MILQTWYFCSTFTHALIMYYVYLQSLQIKAFSFHASERTAQDVTSFSFFSDCTHTCTHHRGLWKYTQLPSDERVFAEIAHKALLHSSTHFPKMKNFVMDGSVIMTSLGVQTQDNWMYGRFRSNWWTGRNNLIILKTKQNNNKRTTILVTELRWDEECRY